MSDPILIRASKLLERRHWSPEEMAVRLTKDIPKKARLQKVAFKFESITITETREGPRRRYHAEACLVPRARRPTESHERDRGFVLEGVRRAFEVYGWEVDPAVSEDASPLPELDAIATAGALSQDFPWFSGNMVEVLTTKLTRYELRTLQVELENAADQLKNETRRALKSPTAFRRRVDHVKARLDR